MKSLSLNRQELSRIIEDGCVYVDKTEIIHNIMKSGTAFFLSRPRRFGKSLLINTFKEIYSGNKELFVNTWIYNAISWDKYPVLKLDFSNISVKQKGLEIAVIEAFHEIAQKYEVHLTDTVSSGLLRELIIKLSEKYGQVVMLIDEYDKPISIQSFFRLGEFHHFWFATGTVTFLVKALMNAGTLPDQVSPREVTLSFFDKFELRNMDLISLLFQTGYLTVKAIDKEYQIYTLAFPNGEVESAFLNNLLEVWSNKVQSEVGEITIGIVRSLQYGDPELFINAFRKLFAGIPYDHFIQKHAIEAIFASNIYTALKIIGVRQHVEVHTSSGRIDAVMEGKEAIFIAEFKMGSAEEAMAQIRSKRYYEPYIGGSKKVFLLALGFDDKSRSISDYLVEMV
ncbi:MAG: hypothetical protein A2015_03025 [Spirochaetes bacterium GWF1_31_7]|nr:MAG: hypothetical protein A2Y30_16485 [Spirochaetes bacterium GWE1_32_154]OHD45319.1 MAG: hypothetical protein A2Y29_08315 [Spirochaetes bacterium GWE2_31_10]OHD50941.1 MAG: hypothetical protein A2015_03025 [Spirochaetes bacterium GWF1_31_7]HBI37286.1 hypothetical protein [Spirochaetia bacterium]